jgi:hypothetical protein
VHIGLQAPLALKQPLCRILHALTTIVSLFPAGPTEFSASRTQPPLLVHRLSMCVSPTSSIHPPRLCGRFPLVPSNSSPSGSNFGFACSTATPHVYRAPPVLGFHFASLPHQAYPHHDYAVASPWSHQIRAQAALPRAYRAPHGLGFQSASIPHQVNSHHDYMIVSRWSHRIRARAARIRFRTFNRPLLHAEPHMLSIPLSPAPSKPPPRLYGCFLLVLLNHGSNFGFCG